MDVTPFLDALRARGREADEGDIARTVEYLLGLGVDVPAILEAIDGDFLTSAGLREMFAGGDLTASEAAEATGTPVERIIDTYRLAGITIDDPDTPLFFRDELEILSTLEVVDSIFVEGEADEILRVVAGALSAVAESIVSVFVGGYENRLETSQNAQWFERTQMTQATGEQAVVFGRALGHLFRHHLRAAIDRQRRSMGTSTDRRLRTMTIGFVDLVGFTAMSAAMSAGELVAFIGDFEARSFDVASRHGGRVVKIIGDEVMISALDAETGCHIVLDIIEEFRTADTAPRAGLATGDVVARIGDFFGSVVNVAARLVDEAVPGEVLACAEIAAIVSGGSVRSEPAGRRALKGFAEPVSVVSISRS